MGRATAALAVIGAMLLLLGCGTEAQTISDEDIVRELRLEKTDGGYTAEDNAFCSVEELLNSPEEIEGLSRQQKQAAITSRDGQVGLMVETPFAPVCERAALKGLDTLARRAERED
jgi:hypothetical protein